MQPYITLSKWSFIYLNLHLLYLTNHWSLLWIFILIFFLFFISQILVRHRVSYVYSYCSNPPANTLDCISGCTGSMVMIANCTESNSAENWADFEGETIFDIKNSTSSPINFRSVLWIYILCNQNSGFSIYFKYGKMIFNYNIQTEFFLE